MIEEVITYIIVVGAAVIAIYLMVKKIAGKRPKPGSSDPAAECADQTACGGCAADCFSRNSSQRPADS